MVIFTEYLMVYPPVTMLKPAISYFLILLTVTCMLCSCQLLKENSKNGFNDGIYKKTRLGKKKVYVLNIGEDTITVIPIIELKDSTILLTKQRVNYTEEQNRVKDNKLVHKYYRPSFDFDLMTITMKYRQATNNIPNQMNTNLNGALYGGYRIDEFKLKYKRTPLNSYKQTVTHIGYSVGLYAGIGSTLVYSSTLTQPVAIDYEGVILLTGIAANLALERLTFGMSFGTDRLLDKYNDNWIYEARPYWGFVVGLNIN